MTPISPSRAEKLRKLREDFVLQLGGLFDSLSDACRNGPPDLALRRAHTLAGTAGTFGLGDVSAEARALELLLQDSPASPRAPELLGRLQAAVDLARRPIL